MPLTLKNFNKTPAPIWLCFKANTAWSTVQLTKQWTPTAVTLETSTDGSNWSTYTIWDTITLTNVWDKLYWRNTSETTTWFGVSYWNYYKFVMTWSIAWSGDITSLINKNLTDTIISDYCFERLFFQCTSLTTMPDLPATTLTTWCYSGTFLGCSWLTRLVPLPATTLATYCYDGMFRLCTNLETLPKLSVTTLPENCYGYMFQWCSKIKLSTSQTWEYQTPFRIPTSWTWTAWSYSLANMFDETWWTFKGTPSINTTYYTSNTVV